jgi:RNA polymerase sigma-70 factor (ECF subfamily)
MTDEEDLLIAARKFQRDALIKIYDVYHPQIYAYAYRTLLDADLAEDCVAVTFQRFLEIMQKGKGPTRFLRAYLYRIAHNWMMDWFRQAHNEIPMFDLEEDRWPAIDPSPVEIVRDRQLKTELLAQMQTLTPEQREVLVLRFFEDHSLQQTANIVKKPLGAVKALQNRAIKKLRQQYLKEYRD